MKYAIRIYDEKNDFEKVRDLIKLVQPDRDVTVDEIRGVAVVAETDSEQIIGFLWSLVGVSSTVYIDDFVTHPDAYRDYGIYRRDIASDLWGVLFKLLYDFKVKKILCSIIHEGVQQTASVLGFKKCEGTLMKASSDDIKSCMDKLTQ